MCLAWKSHVWHRVFWFMAYAWSVSIPRVVLCPSSFYTSSLGASWVLPPPSRSNVLYNYDYCDFLTILFDIFWFQRLVFIFVLLQGHVCEAGPLDALFRAPCRKLGTLCPPIMAKNLREQSKLELVETSGHCVLLSCLLNFDAAEFFGPCHVQF